MFYLDAGNTRIKVARATDSGWERVASFEHHDIPALQALLGNEPSIGCTVVDSLISLLPHTRWYRRGNILPARLNYHTPETLGVDRFVACHGAWISVHQAVIVVDAGTAVTVDLMDSSGVFQGGVIMPGLAILETGLNAHAPALPKVPRELSSTYPPKSTIDALKAGLLESWVAGITHHVRQLHAFAPDAVVMVTGSDAGLLTSVGEVKPDLMFDGLRALTR